MKVVETWLGIGVKAGGRIRQLTDAGRGQITGLWSDLGPFKTPTLCSVFHNGIAPTIEDVVRHYEVHLGLVYTNQERADLGDVSECALTSMSVMTMCSTAAVEKSDYSRRLKIGEL